MLLLAAFQTLLHRYSAQEPILVGSPCAGRTRSEAENLHRTFLNTLVCAVIFPAIRRLRIASVRETNRARSICTSGFAFLKKLSKQCSASAMRAVRHWCKSCSFWQNELLKPFELAGTQGQIHSDSQLRREIGSGIVAGRKCGWLERLF